MAYIRACLLGLRVVGVSAGIWAITSLAADDPVRFDTTLPPEYNAASNQYFANIFTSCMNIQPQLNSMQDMLAGGSGMGEISINTACPDGGSRCIRRR